jgi:hypothetical protein
VNSSTPVDHSIQYLQKSLFCTEQQRPPPKRGQTTTAALAEICLPFNLSHLCPPMSHIGAVCNIGPIWCVGVVNPPIQKWHRQLPIWARRT